MRQRKFKAFVLPTDTQVRNPITIKEKGEMIELESIGVGVFGGLDKKYWKVRVGVHDGCGDECVIYVYYDRIVEWTGLKDKNGVEIYESNIVRRDYHLGHFDDKMEWVRDSYQATGFFKWIDHGFHIEHIGGDVCAFNDPEGEIWFADELTVVGNIFENPELIEE